MFNLKIGNNSILEYINDYNAKAEKEGYMGVSIEINDIGLEIALDDSDWSEFMSSNGAKFSGSDNKNYYYEIGDKVLFIPIDCTSFDGSDVYLDVNNVEVCSIIF